MPQAVGGDQRVVDRAGDVAQAVGQLGRGDHGGGTGRSIMSGWSLACRAGTVPTRAEARARRSVAKVRCAGRVPVGFACPCRFA